MDVIKILIIGGGYAGVKAALDLNKAYRRNDNVVVTLVDRNRFHTLMTELHEIAGDRVPQASVKICYDRIFVGTRVNVVHDEIVRVDFDGRTAMGRIGSYSYDQVLICTGGKPDDFNIPGVKDNTLSLWSLDDALAIRSRLERNFRLASLEPNPENRRKLMSVVVAGGGFTGVELVGELIEYLPELCTKYDLPKEEIRLYNVEALGHILGMLPEKIREKAVGYMEKKGVEIRTTALVVKAEKDSFHFKNGSVLEAGILVWTCGVKGSDLLGGLELKKGKASRREVDGYMRSPGREDVYLAGDGVWFLEDGKPIPQIVEAAEQTAETAAHNMMVYIDGRLGRRNGRRLKEYRGNYHGFMVSIGSKFAVSHTGGISLSGFAAMALKHLVNLYYQIGVVGINGVWAYLKHEILDIRNNRSLIGGFVAWKTPNYWLLPLRVYLGVMWFLQGIHKVGDGWLNRVNDFISVPAADAVAAATDAVASNGATLLDKPLDVYLWVAQLTVNRAPFLFQSGIVIFELLIGLALVGGAFTWLAAAASFVFSVMLIVGAMADASIFWYMIAALAMLGGAGRAFGLDYWIMPWLKKWWNGTRLAGKTHLYVGEPTRRRPRRRPSELAR